jgi:hypothetical protein
MRVRVLLPLCLLLGAAAVALVVALVASGGGSAPQATEARGFLPTFTPSPTPTRVPDARVGQKGECPPLPRPMCARPGDEANLYDELGLARVLFVKLTYCCSDERWVKRSAELDGLLKMLDRDVMAERSVFDVMQSARAMLPDPFAIEFVWGGEAWPPYWYREHELNLNLREGFLADAATGTRWPLPDGFAERLRALAEDEGTSATPDPEVFATSTPTLPVTLAFAHPAGPLVWDGPDAAVVSQAEGHCAVETAGPPGYINVRNDMGFWLQGAVKRDDAWHWTGYRHDDWRVFQGDDPAVLYLVHDGVPAIALRYRSFPCY